MLRYEQIADKAKDILAMTGYTKEEFIALLPQFQKSYDEYLQRIRLKATSVLDRYQDPITTVHYPPLKINCSSSSFISSRIQRKHCKDTYLECRNRT